MSLRELGEGDPGIFSVRTFSKILATWTDPDGGFFLWMTLPEDVDAQALFEVALAEGVAYIPGAAFSPGGRFRNALRLCFASTTPERTRVGVQRPRRAVDLLTTGARDD